MADQTVKISNLPDSGSPERVAFDMMKWTIGYLPMKPDKAQILQVLQVYQACLEVTRGGDADVSQIT